MMYYLRTSFLGLHFYCVMESVLWELDSVIYSALWFYCNYLEMVTHMLWWGFVPCTSQRTLGFSWVSATLKLFKNATLKMLIWVTLWKSLTKSESLLVSAGEWQVKQTFLQQVVSPRFKGSPSEWWCVELHELIASASWCCSLLKILTPYRFPMAFQTGRTLLIHHMRNLWYDIIRS